MDLISARLNALRYAEGFLASGYEAAREPEKAIPAFGRWAEETSRALKDAGLPREEQRFWSDVAATRYVESRVQVARATLETLHDQIRQDPGAFGLRRRAELASESATVANTTPSRWPRGLAIFGAGVLTGVYGVRPAAAAVVRWFASARAAMTTLLSRVADLFVPGPPGEVPAWLPLAALWFLIAALGVAGGLVVSLLATDVQRDGTRVLWTTGRGRGRLAFAIVAAAAAAALTAAAQ